MTYSSSIAAGRRGYLRRNQNRVTFANSGKTLGPISNSLVLILMACLIGLLYLTQVTKTNSYGYSINNLKQEQAELERQKSNLEVSAARLRSLDRVAESPVAKSMVPVAPSDSIH